MPHVRPRRMLRRFEARACAAALQCDRASDDRVAGARRVVGLVLRASPLLRSCAGALAQAAITSGRAFRPLRFPPGQDGVAMTATSQGRSRLRPIRFIRPAARSGTFSSARNMRSTQRSEPTPRRFRAATRSSTISTSSARVSPDALSRQRCARWRRSARGSCGRAGRIRHDGSLAESMEERELRERVRMALAATRVRRRCRPRGTTRR